MKPVVFESISGKRASREKSEATGNNSVRLFRRVSKPEISLWKILGKIWKKIKKFEKIWKNMKKYEKILKILKKN